jgi:hypothetical protein
VGDDGRQRREQPLRLGELDVGGRVPGLRVEGADDADRGPQDVHGVRGEREFVDDPADPCVQRPPRPLGGREGREFLTVGQVTAPQQPGDLLEGAVLGEFLDGVAPVEQRVRRGVHLGDRGRVGDDTREPLVDLGRGGIGGGRHGRFLRVIAIGFPRG